MHSFLMIGQSNMAGRGFLHEVTPIYNEKIHMLRNGRWQMMVEPINYDRPVSGVSLAASFADTWSQENPEDTIGLIPCAEGGSTLDEWSVDGLLFKHAVSEARFAMERSQLTGILWHQGESDSSNGNYKDYYQKLLTIIDALRKELNAPTIPLIIGGLGDYLGKKGFGTYATEHELINQELERFASEQDNCYFVTAAGLTANPDGIHLDAASQRIFGLRYYEAYAMLDHVTAPLEDEEKRSQSIKQVHTAAEKLYLASMDFALGKITYEEFNARMVQINSK